MQVFIPLLMVLFCVLWTAEGSDQPGARRLDVKSRVLDLAFKSDLAPAPYIRRMTLRFGDTDTQFTIIVYPGGKTELITHQLANASRERLAQLVEASTNGRLSVSDRQIAEELEVEVSRSFVDYTFLAPVVEELSKVRLSPVLVSRVAVDEWSEYEFSYDTWQESVHYTLLGPHGEDPQDQLTRWMVHVRPILQKLAKAPEPRR